MNLGMMLGNIGAMGWYLASNDPTVGMAMLGTTAGLSAIMGVTLTSAIGGKLSGWTIHFIPANIKSVIE
jgi:NAD(P) transhydrogenase